MIRIHKDNVVPKYSTGKWFWNPHAEELTFSSWKSDVLERELYVELSSGYKFKATLDQLEEVIFRQEFTSQGGSKEDNEFIRLEDIKNLVLFLAPKNMMRGYFINFIHTRPVDLFLNALVIYFEYFLRLVEFILIRRDEVSGKAAQVENADSTKIKRVFSANLSQYRLLLAREYSVILVGNGEMAPYYHLEALGNISNTTKDRRLHEDLLAFATQVVWIAHHRRAFEVIDNEMNRLFRSDHFKLAREDAIELSLVERELLYGKNNKQVNCRRQNSPVIQEITNVTRQNLPILWIGEKKYRGNDLRIQQLELEFIVPDSALNLIEVRHGILGTPKNFYNTLLSINWAKVRDRQYSEAYDPFLLVNQPYLEIPNLEKVKDLTKEQHESYFRIKDNRHKYNQSLIKKWKMRDQVIEYIKSGDGLVIDVVHKCRNEVKTQSSEAKMSVRAITEAFVMKKKLLGTK